MNDRTRNGLVSALVFAVALAVLLFLLSGRPGAYGSVEERRSDFISLKNSIIGELINSGKYSCCLEKPCTYCIEKSPGHGDGASCACLDDVMNGRHPCGECIGEILEGEGNPMIAKYFASALADEIGEQHKPALKRIIYEKYGVPEDEQI